MVKSLQTFQSFQSLSAQRLQRFATIYNACNDLQRPKRLQRKKAPENRKAFVNICAILLILYLTPGKVHYAASCMLHLVSRILYPASCIPHPPSKIKRTRHTKNIGLILIDPLHIGKPDLDIPVLSAHTQSDTGIGCRAKAVG